MNRLVITTALGVVAGVVCVLGGISLGIALTPATVGWILLNRTVLGFVIGASGLRMHWAWHGLLMGLVIGSLFSYAGFLLGRGPLIVSGTLSASLIFGVVIEALTSVVFKQPRPLVTEVRAKAAAI